MDELEAVLNDKTEIKKEEPELIDLPDSEEKAPTYSLYSFMDEREGDDEYEFDFRIQVPNNESGNFKPIEFLVFLALSRINLVNTYEAALQQAIMGYISLNEDADAESARADIEEYIRDRLTSGYEEN